MNEILSEQHTSRHRAKAGKVWMAKFPDGGIFQIPNSKGTRRAWATKGALITAITTMGARLWNMHNENWGYTSYEIFIDDLFCSMEIIAVDK